MFRRDWPAPRSPATPFSRTSSTPDTRSARARAEDVGQGEMLRSRRQRSSSPKGGRDSSDQGGCDSSPRRRLEFGQQRDQSPMATSLRVRGREVAAQRVAAPLESAAPVRSPSFSHAAPSLAGSYSAPSIAQPQLQSRALARDSSLGSLSGNATTVVAQPQLVHSSSTSSFSNAAPSPVGCYTAPIIAQPQFAPFPMSSPVAGFRAPILAQPQLAPFPRMGLYAFR